MQFGPWLGPSCSDSFFGFTVPTEKREDMFPLCKEMETSTGSTRCAPHTYHAILQEELGVKKPTTLTGLEDVLQQSVRRIKTTSKLPKPKPVCNILFFFLEPFCRRISVLDCCIGQSPGKGNDMTVVLASHQATKRLVH